MAAQVEAAEIIQPLPVLEHPGKEILVELV
jgi:hypothetical protein